MEWEIVRNPFFYLYEDEIITIQRFLRYKLNKPPIIEENIEEIIQKSEPIDIKPDRVSHKNRYSYKYKIII